MGFLGVVFYYKISGLHFEEMESESIDAAIRWLVESSISVVWFVYTGLVVVKFIKALSIKGIEAF